MTAAEMTICSGFGQGAGGHIGDNGKENGNYCIIIGNI